MIAGEVSPDSIWQFMDKVGELLEMLYFWKFLTIDNFEAMSRLFGVKYREYLHVPRRIRMFKRLGPSREDLVEHEHQIRKRYLILPANVKDKRKKND